MLTDTQTCDVVLPGYVLTERIGSGGYAEVWRAEAPGGIAKAVKIVFGHYDDELASQELKALERVKGVRHPFLLSLERFEVINGRLAILTELADMSLDQRLRQCRAEGLSGIPRDELLRYVSDAAEALDFLSQRHNLLHLDIKPENLLVLGDHVKVADFGLVKELAARTQNSLVSGMTPTYAAPEMFDDEPTVHSDQYSLAIVYQEMLVGSLPFPGRTAAQLAKQHTLAAPQLNALPEEDRPVVARALAKNPTERFPSCRAFVDALLRREAAIPQPTPTELPRRDPFAPPTPYPNPDDTTPPSYSTTIRRTPDKPPEEPAATVTQPVNRGNPPATSAAAQPAAPPTPIVDEEVVDVAVPPTNIESPLEQPTLYIAVGGTGIHVLCRLRALVMPAEDADARDLPMETIALDTDRDQLRDACSSRWTSPLNPDDALHLPLRMPQDYDNSREMLNWVSRRWLYNIPRSLETRGYRPLGRIALVDHAARVGALIDQKLERLAAKSANNPGSATRAATIKVVLLAGTGGGTGAGTVLDLANAVKSLAANRGIDVETHGFMLCNCFGRSTSAPLMAANTYSLLTELHHATACGNEGTGERAAQPNIFESPNPPFDQLYWVPANTGPDHRITADDFHAVAGFLQLDSIPEAGTILRSIQASKTPRETKAGRTLVIKNVGYASMADQKRAVLNQLAGELADAVRRHWLSADTSKDWERLVKHEQLAARLPRSDGATDDSNETPEVAPSPAASPLRLRARFQKFMSLEFVSELLRQIERRLESRDARGRQLVAPNQAIAIVDAACNALAALAGHEVPPAAERTKSTALAPLVAVASTRVLRHLVENADASHPESSLSLASIDEQLSIECRALLEENIGQSGVAAEIASLINVDQATTGMLDCVAHGPVQWGCDRRTLVLAPKDESQNAVAESLQAKRPQTAVLPANVDDVQVIVEETGISPRSIARGIEHVFPGIADASHRLHTRTDIPWQRLA